MPRAILCVLDSFGIGSAPDAADYTDGHGHNDVGANTLLHIAQNYELHLPNLDALGLGAAGKLACGTLAPGLSDTPRGGRFGVGREVSKGKDTPSGHWEIAGVPVPFSWGYFPQEEPAFPKALTDALIRDAGLPGILGNKHASGTVS
jgi:phosphopentomutase